MTLKVFQTPGPNSQPELGGHDNGQYKKGNVVQAHFRVVKYIRKLVTHVVKWL